MTMLAPAALAGLALGGCHRASPRIVVSDAWARASAPGQPNAALYLTLANRGTGGDSLVEVEVPRARSAALHQMTVEDGVMRMRALPGGVVVRPGETVTLAPAATHVMVSGLAAPLIAGERIEARLHFARSADQTVAVRVEAASAR